MILPLTKQYIPKVVIKCMTYNHSDYILDALNGFAMQETSFPFVCVVMDDASTDGEQNVIRDYLVNECDYENAEKPEIDEAEVFVAGHKANKNCTFAFYLLKQNLYGTGKKGPLFSYWERNSEYIALCEGDDYWTDPAKLQKQFDFLENHPNYSICSTEFQELDEASETRVRYICDVTDITFERELVENCIGTLSVCYRKEAIAGYTNPFNNAMMGDYQLWLHLLTKGKGRCLHEDTSVYRIHSGSAYHPVDKYKSINFSIDVLRIRSYYAQKFNAMELIGKESKYEIDLIIRGLYKNYISNVHVKYLREIISNFHPSGWDKLKLWGICSKRRSRIVKIFLEAAGKI